MKFFIAVTDNDWFTLLSQLQPDEVNFWNPGGVGFKALLPGQPFLFKLHAPLNAIVGGGYFAHPTQLPLSLAWDAFGEKNGAESLGRLRDMINKRRKDAEPNPMIGCILLNQPFFWPRELWIPQPPEWSGNIVRGKSYDSREAVGARIWQQVEERLFVTAEERVFDSLSDSWYAPVFGPEYLRKSRLGQGIFRTVVTDVYHRRCAVSGERTLPVLEAAHIKPVSEKGENRIDNGLLLRSDIHILFDQGYLTITPDYRVEVSNKIREEFDNGRDYYQHHGRPLKVVPGAELERPAGKLLRWHNENIFKG